MTGIIFDKPDELNSLTPKNEAYLDSLKNKVGVYLITINNSKKYVGSAYGEEGLYGRWKQYINYFKPDSKSLKDSKRSKKNIGEELRGFHKGNFKEISFEVLETISECRNRLENNLNNLNIIYPEIKFAEAGELLSIKEAEKKLLADLQKDGTDKVTAKGVYLITVNNETEYVGFADGEESLYGKWKQYINYFKPDSDSKRSEFGIAEKLQDFHKGNFKEISFKVLAMIVDIENYWKEEKKSKSKYKNGLNDN